MTTVYPYKQNKLLLCNSGVIEPNQIKEIEIFAARGGAFKPTEIQIYALDEAGAINNSFEILNVCILGQPQLVNYNGFSNEKERGIVKTFEISQSIDWQVFGSSHGLGLCISFKNINRYKKGIVYITIKGHPADCSLIGKG